MSADDFSAFYATSFPRVFAAVRAFCGDVDVAHDATQEAFARAYARWRRVKETGWPQAWVTTTAMNLSRRNMSRRLRKAQADREAAAPGPTTDRLDVLSALRALPERQRQAVVLHYLLDCPVATVADHMNLWTGR